MRIADINPVRMSEIEGPESDSKRRLIAAGERLFGSKGMNGTALHEIAFAAGQANKYAVQYHFEGRDGLIAAIFALRARSLGRRRTELVERVRQLGLLADIDALLEALFVPMVEQVDEEGRHSYARFLLQYMASPEYDRLSDSVHNAWSGGTGALYELIGEAVGASAEEMFARAHIYGFIMLAALVDHDNLVGNNHPAPALEMEVERSVQAAAAVLLAEHTAIPKTPSAFGP